MNQGIKYLKKSYLNSIIICTSALSLFSVNISGQTGGIIDSKITESGLFLENLKFQFQPKKNTSDIHTLDIQEFRFGFSDIQFQNKVDSNMLSLDVSINGPNILLKNLEYKSDLIQQNWITKEKLKRIDDRESEPKVAIKKIDEAIDTYFNDQGNPPETIDDLIINQYIDISKAPFSNKWSYALDIPNTIVSTPTHINPIPKTQNIIFDYQTKSFLVNQKIDSLSNVPLIQWEYIFKINNIILNNSSVIDLILRDKNTDFSLIMEKSQFKINDISFKANPIDQLNNIFLLSIPNLLVELENIVLECILDSTYIIHKGKADFKINNFKIKIPDELGKDPDMEKFLTQIGVWNNSIDVRLVDFKIEIINQFTGNLSLNINTPFIKILFDGGISIRQDGQNLPKIFIHNSKAVIKPIALGIKKWINKWEKKNRGAISRKGSDIELIINGPIKNLDIKSINK